MADTVRTLSALQTLLADNTSEAISPQDIRDFLVSAYPTFVGGRLVRGSTQSVDHNTETNILWDTEVYDPQGFHDTGSNTDRITAPSGYAGYYYVMVRTSWTAAATGQYVTVALYHSVDGLFGADRKPWTNSSVFQSHGFAAGLVYLDEAEYVYAAVYQNTGSARTLTTETHIDWFRIGLAG